MTSKVYFSDFVGCSGFNVLDRILAVAKSAGLKDFIQEEESIALKMHFGEMGNTRMLRPQFVKIVVDYINRQNAKPFLTDCNTLFYRQRYDAIEHLNTAAFNGYDTLGTNAPIIIADGLLGLDGKVLEGPNNSKYKFGSALVEADKIIVLTHFKGHDDVGFGGIIKNIGMGALVRGNKQKVHSHLLPYVEEDKCQGCGKCQKICPHNAISIAKTAFIDQNKCQNCNSCLVVCPHRAIPIRWERDDQEMQKKLLESCAAFVNAKKDSLFYISYLVDITAFCDCRSWSPLPIIDDIGIVAGNDLLAVEQASYDLVNKAVIKRYPGKNLASFTGIDGTAMLDYAEQFNLGSRKYELINIQK